MKLEVGNFYKTRDGRKVGPMAIEESQDSTSFHWNVQGAGVGRWDESGDDGYASIFTAADNDLIAEWTTEPTGPVRTVTRKEIVSGQYGIVNVDADRPTGNPRIVVSAVPTITEIRAAIATLTEIADALEASQ